MSTQLKQDIEGPEFTFTPGAPKSANTYGDWSALMAKIANQPSRRPVITFTDNFTIPTGTWNLKGATLRSPTPIVGQVTLTINDDVILDNVFEITDGLYVLASPVTAHDTFTFTETPSGEYKTLLISRGAALGNSGAEALITVSTGESLYLGLDSAATLAVSPLSAPYINGVTGCIVVGSCLLAGTVGGFPDNWVAGDGALIYQAGGDFNNPLPSLPSWVGTVSTNYSAKAPNVLYTPTFPINWPSPNPTSVQEALDDLVDRNQGVEVLAGLSNPATYFPNEFLGPFYNRTTDPSVAAFGSGSGFFRATQKGVYSNFCWTNSITPGTDVDMQIWLAPGGIPSLFSFTGITITMPGGAYITSNTVDTLHVDPGDLILAYNPSLSVGYTASNLTLTAHFKLELS